MTKGFARPGRNSFFVPFDEGKLVAVPAARMGDGM
jgi:hypothetical protein